MNRMREENRYAKRLLDEKGSTLSPARQKKIAALLAVPETITKDLKTYTKNPAPIEKRPDEITHTIESLR